MARQNHPHGSKCGFGSSFLPNTSCAISPEVRPYQIPLHPITLLKRRVALVWCLVLMPWQIELLVFIPAKSQLQCPIKPWNLRSVFWLSGCFHRDSQPLWIIWHFVHLSKHNFVHLSKHTLRWLLSHLFKLSKHANLWSRVTVDQFSSMNTVHCS